MQKSERDPRARLAEQLPEAHFPSGVSSPSAVLLLLLLLLAGVCVVVLRTTEPGQPPNALLESQERLASGVGRSMGIAARGSTADLRSVAELSTGGPADLAAAVLQSHPRWRGTALIDSATKKVLAARGESVPTSSLPLGPDETVRPLVSPDGEVRLLVTVPLSGGARQGKTLAALSTARISAAPVDASLQQGLLLVASDGQLIDSRGTAPTAGDKATWSLIKRAVAAAGAGQQGTMIGEPTRNPVKGGRGTDTRTTVVAYAPVAADGLSGTLGLTVVSVLHAPVPKPETTWRGLLPAVALIAVALFGFVLIRTVVVRPVRRLRAGALAVAGGRLRGRIDPFRITEIQRITVAIEHCRHLLRGKATPGPYRHFGVSASTAVVIAAAAVLGWSAGVSFTLGREDVLLPGSVVTAVRSQVGSTTEAFRRSLNDGLADLRAVARLTKGPAPTGLQAALDGLAARQTRFRSIYVVDASGSITAEAGRQPLREDAPPPKGDGVKQHNTSGRLPVFFAHAALPDGKHTLIGEFDLDHLSGLLDRSPGRVRVVDSGGRTLIANHGYVAFEELSDSALRYSAKEALAGRPVAKVTQVNGERSVLVSRPISGRGAASALRWVIVADQPASALALAGNELRRDALMVALVGVALALALFGWHHFVVIKPLRRVAHAADELVGGDTQTVVYPQRQDQIGTIACCLEICRQALVDGVGRLGEVRRPTGAATDATVLFTRITGEHQPRPAPGATVGHPGRQTGV